jgi:hypothetical protein
VQEVAHHVGDVVGEPAGEELRLAAVGVEQRGVLVDRLEQVGQRRAQPLEVGVEAGVRLEPLV